MTEFWRRWHISLSTWFRDYLYIPLGGNRRGRLRLYANLLVVFFLCGLWHGASWTSSPGACSTAGSWCVERLGYGRRLETRPAPLRHAYTMLAVMVGWVFFRADSMGQASACSGRWRASGPGRARYQSGALRRLQVILALPPA